MAFGRNHEPDYLAMNPNGRVPTLVDGDFVLWESNSIMRYLVLAYRPAIADLSAGAEACAPASTAGWTGRFRRCSRSIVRCSGRWCEPRSNSATWSRSRRMPTPRPMQWRIVDAQLATRRFIEGDDFTIADIALGAYARRWFGVEGVNKPKLPHLERWFAQFAERPGFQAIHRAADVVSAVAQRRALAAADARYAPPTLTQVLGALDFDKTRTVGRAGTCRRRHRVSTAAARSRGGAGSRLLTAEAARPP